MKICDEELDLEHFAQNYDQEDRDRLINEACQFSETRHRQARWERRHDILMCCQRARGADNQAGWVRNMLKFQRNWHSVFKHIIKFL